jgi:hypothetical protein
MASYCGYLHIFTSRITVQHREGNWFLNLYSKTASVCCINTVRVHMTNYLLIYIYIYIYVVVPTDARYIYIYILTNYLLIYIYIYIRGGTHRREIYIYIYIYMALATGRSTHTYIIKNTIQQCTFSTVK